MAGKDSLHEQFPKLPEDLKEQVYYRELDILQAGANVEFLFPDGEQ